MTSTSEAEANDRELRALAGAVAAGDTAALEEVLRRIYPLVMKRTSRFLPCLQDAEEACQDAMTSIARKIGSYAGTGSC